MYFRVNEVFKFEYSFEITANKYIFFNIFLENSYIQVHKIRKLQFFVS